MHLFPPIHGMTWSLSKTERGARAFNLQQSTRCSLIHKRFAFISPRASENNSKARGAHSFINASRLFHRERRQIKIKNAHFSSKLEVRFLILIFLVLCTKAANGNRTRDLRTTNATLYLLSHSSICNENYIIIVAFILSINCSIRCCI